MKMPAPIIAPLEIMAASNRLSVRRDAFGSSISSSHTRLEEQNQFNKKIFGNPPIFP
jgi:hypothetical protein